MRRGSGILCLLTRCCGTACSRCVCGVMSFLVSRRGTVFESDLGAATRETAAALTAFDPDASWRALK